MRILHSAANNFRRKGKKIMQLVEIYCRKNADFRNENQQTMITDANQSGQRKITILPLASTVARGLKIGKTRGIRMLDSSQRLKIEYSSSVNVEMRETAEPSGPIRHVNVSKG